MSWIRYAHAHIHYLLRLVQRAQSARHRAWSRCSNLRPSLSLLLRESVELEKYRGSEPEVTIWCPMCYLAVLTARLAALLCIIFSVRLYKTAADSRKYKS